MMKHLYGRRLHERFPFVAFASAQAVAVVRLGGTPRIVFD